MFPIGWLHTLADCNLHAATSGDITRNALNGSPKMGTCQNVSTTMYVSVAHKISNTPEAMAKRSQTTCMLTSQRVSTNIRQSDFSFLFAWFCYCLLRLKEAIEKCYISRAFYPNYALCIHPTFSQTPISETVTLNQYPENF